MQKTPFLDFIGVTWNKLTTEITVTFFVVTLFLIVLSVIGRRSQVYV